MPSIRCEPGDQLLPVTDVCRWRFNSAGAQDLTGDFFDPISWTCWDGASSAGSGAPPSTTTNPSAACVGGVAGPACPPKAPPGRACLIINPTATTRINRGQIGWAYRRSTARTWRFGSTDGPFRVRDRWNFRGHSWWRTATTFNGVLRAFRAEPGPYTAYRCTNVTTSSAHNADKEVAAQFARFRLGVTDNCLTRAVAILRAYGAKLPGTDVSTFPDFPTAYVAKNLAGWEAPKPLSRGGVSRAAFTFLALRSSFAAPDQRCRSRCPRGPLGHSRSFCIHQSARRRAASGTGGAPSACTCAGRWRSTRGAIACD
jgi:hypothetical protein